VLRTSLPTLFLSRLSVQFVSSLAGYVSKSKYLSDGRIGESGRLPELLPHQNATQPFPAPVTWPLEGMAMAVHTPRLCGSFVEAVCVAFTQ